MKLQRWHRAAMKKILAGHSLHISAGRQMGKTLLSKEIVDNIMESRGIHRHIIYMDCSGGRTRFPYPMLDPSGPYEKNGNKLFVVDDVPHCRGLPIDYIIIDEFPLLGAQEQNRILQELGPLFCRAKVLVTGSPSYPGTGNLFDACSVWQTMGVECVTPRNLEFEQVARSIDSITRFLNGSR